MKTTEILTLALLLACAGCSSGPAPDTKAADTKAADANAADIKAKDQADIKALEDRFMAAMKARDVNAIMACYVPDQSLIVFDAVPPRQYTGADAYKKDWQEFLAMFPGPMDPTIEDLDITTGGDVAYSHSIQHVSLTDKKGKKTEMAVRVSDGYKKINGQWLISHEHVSVPVNIETLKAELNSK
jgi:uncharacterized protein (TIGR02246 family)